jgi:hypothetical protein
MRGGFAFEVTGAALGKRVPFVPVVFILEGENVQPLGVGDSPRPDGVVQSRFGGLANRGRLGDHRTYSPSLKYTRRDSQLGSG